MSDLFGNQIVGFLTHRLSYLFLLVYLVVVFFIVFCVYSFLYYDYVHICNNSGDCIIDKHNQHTGYLETTDTTEKYFAVLKYLSGNNLSRIILVCGNFSQIAIYYLS